MKNVNEHIKRQIGSICKILEDEKYISFDLENRLYTFMERGKVASQFSELLPLVLTEHLELIENLTIK